MQIREIVLYNASGDERRVAFQLGSLNIVTGESRTGKSALLHIVEYCLGRDTLTVPAGIIADSVEWYGLLLQLPTTRVFVARPRPRARAASTSLVMLSLGAVLEPPSFGELLVNSNTAALREELGRLMGIEENRHLPPAGALRSPLEAGLGQASLLCFQGQGEVANPGLLFHRQNEDGITQALRDTLPYFLGAVAPDQALKRLQLMQARRDLRRAEEDFLNAERSMLGIDGQVQALVDEAYGSGLIKNNVISSRDEALTLLRTVVDNSQTPAAPDDESFPRRRQLEEDRTRLRQELRTVADQRALLLDEASSLQGYEGALRGQVGRLSAVELVTADSVVTTEGVCPVCGNELEEPDPTVGQLGHALRDLRRQLDGIQVSRPRREEALRGLDERAEQARQRLTALEAALRELSSGNAVDSQDAGRAEILAFRRGRIDANLSRLRPTGNTLSERTSAVALARRVVEELETALDPAEEREQITSRLNVIGASMTEWALALELNDGGREMRLDLNRLTVVSDSAAGPVPLSRVGSAENWVGYHLVALLALHRHFVDQSRPVPRFLMLDQPTQAYYPSEREQVGGDADQAAVRRLFRLIRTVVTLLAPNFQIIVCDHADLDEEWFQQAIGDNNWRGGKKLIPDWWSNGPST